MPNNLFLFTGEADFLLHEQISTWKNAFTQKHGDINLAILDAEETPLYEIMAAVNAMPFLGDKRLIFIHGLPDKPKTRQTEEPTKKDEKRDAELKKLEADLDEIPESSVVVFVQGNPDKRKSFYKKLTAKAELKEFLPFSGQVLTNWIQKRVQTKGARMDSTVCDYLVFLAGQDLWRLSQEIDKLSAHSSGQSITKPMIDSLVVPSLEANIFHLTDALGSKDHRKAIQHLHRSLAAGESLRQVFYMIVRQFRLLLQGCSYQINQPNANPTAFAATLKLHPFVARNTMAQMKNFNISQLKDAYARLLDIDTDIKTSRIKMTTDNQDELALAIERFIIKFCS